MKATNPKFNIIKDRIGIYEDFTFNLLYYIKQYYLDKETLKLDVDIKNHYNWCFNKVCDEFKEEGLDFSTNEKLREYFYGYYYHQIYKIEEIQPLTYYENFWEKIFEVDEKRAKNKNILKVLIEVYQIFDMSITKEKNILELA
jgi:hypothetical protein